MKARQTRRPSQGSNGRAQEDAAQRAAMQIQQQRQRQPMYWWERPPQKPQGAVRKWVDRVLVNSDPDYRAVMSHYKRVKQNPVYYQTVPAPYRDILANMERGQRVAQRG